MAPEKLTVKRHRVESPSSQLAPRASSPHIPAQGTRWPMCNFKSHGRSAMWTTIRSMRTLTFGSSCATLAWKNAWCMSTRRLIMRSPGNSMHTLSHLLKTTRSCHAFVVEQSNSQKMTSSGSYPWNRVHQMSHI